MEVAAPSTRLADAVGAAETLIEQQRHEEALAALHAVEQRATPDARLELRALLAEAWALVSLGRLETAEGLLARARALAQRPELDDVARADVLFRLGSCRLAQGAFASATALLTLALDLCDRAPVTSDRLRARVLERRARAYRMSRDWDAARADVERAIELAEALGDVHTAAHAYFQASIVAEREKQWLLARFNAEHALALYEQVGDAVSAGKVQNNLGGILFLLGKPEEARELLARAHRAALDAGNEVDAGYAVGSLAQVEVRTGMPLEGEQHARRALILLDGRSDHVLELAATRLVLARALLDQGRADEAEREVDQAENAFRRVASVSHMAEALLARGDCARHRGDAERAAELYRAAAELLRDTHF
ncbi:MAG TPA: tetratricopeptide repeat protein [Gaiellaceae bacterium]|nr:tetratricopeptide repeat protein [Gaiellaceae bacterium]